MSLAEQNYDIGNRELLAIKLALVFFCSFFFMKRKECTTHYNCSEWRYYKRGISKGETCKRVGICTWYKSRRFRGETGAEKGRCNTHGGPTTYKNTFKNSFNRVFQHHFFCPSLALPRQNLGKKQTQKRITSRDCSGLTVFQWLIVQSIHNLKAHMSFKG